MSKQETWYCAQCGGTDIRHDAIVQWNNQTGDWELLSVLDDDWCEDCEEQRNDPGEPVFGVPEVKAA